MKAIRFLLIALLVGFFLLVVLLRPYMVHAVVYAALAGCSLWLIFWAKGKKRREKAGYGLVLLGLAIANTVALYWTLTFMASPQSPDARHTVMWLSHGQRRYVSPSQEHLVWRANLTGVAILVTGGALWFPWGKPKQHDANR